jgi:hypothetical protein
VVGLGEKIVNTQILNSHRQVPVERSFCGEGIYVVRGFIPVEPGWHSSAKRSPCPFSHTASTAFTAAAQPNGVVRHSDKSPRHKSSYIAAAMGSEMAELDTSSDKLGMDRDMTMHHYRAILRRRFIGEKFCFRQVMPLRKPGFPREFSLNVVVYRVKNPVGSFLYCTPR